MARPIVARHSRHLGPTVSFFQAVSSWHAYRDYTAVSELGHGQHGVAMLLRCSKTGAEVVAKQVAVNGMGEYELGLLEREIIILRTLNHPNIIRYHCIAAGQKRYGRGPTAPSAIDDDRNSQRQAYIRPQ